MGWTGFGKFVTFSLMLLGGGVALYFGVTQVGLALAFSAVLGQLWTTAVSLWEQRNDEIINRKDLVRARMAFGIAATQWDDETRHFLAREWPEMGVEFGEEQISYILDGGVNTGILIPFLREFLQDSTEKSFVDVRNYNDDKRIQDRFNVSRETVRVQWKLATEYLESKRYLQEGSMAGSRTWLWTSPEHFKILRRRYINYRHPKELQA